MPMDRQYFWSKARELGVPVNEGDSKAILRRKIKRYLQGFLMEIPSRQSPRKGQARNKGASKRG